jgi:hypothetical protein
MNNNEEKKQRRKKCTCFQYETKGPKKKKGRNIYAI